MKQKMKLHYKAALSLTLSAVLFAVPITAFSLNGGNVLAVRAEETTPGDSGAGSNDKGKDSTEDDFNSVEENTEEGGESGGDLESECTCQKKCTVSESDKQCEVCAANYKACEYKIPNVRIDINKPGGWYKDGSVSVTFEVSDVAHTGNFELASMQAKIGQNGGWTDVTEDKTLEISENCTIYVQATDQNGNTYEKNRAVRCFDTTKPTLNAAVSDGLLSVEVHDIDSGAKAVYVNGYAFKKLTNGVLNIRLQKFDAGYEYFTIYAMDNAGNLSEVYKTKNPYYKDPADESDENPEEQLPTNAEATNPGKAEAKVTEHTKTDGEGNIVSHVPLGQEAVTGDSDSEENGDSKEAAQGKEFYTIQSESGKVFYLVIDREGDEEKVHFLTEITENDLLNVTSENSDTLPKNSAALASAVQAEEGALPNNNGELTDTELPGKGGEDLENVELSDNIEDTEGAEDRNSAKDTDGVAPLNGYLLIGVIAAIFIGGAYYFKVARKKKEGFIEEEDEDEEETEDYGEEESGDGSDDDFFDEGM